MWPTPQAAADRFYRSNLKSAVGLLISIAADRSSRGSGRPPGEPQAEWRAVLVLALAALEAGLVDIGLAAHHQRIVNQKPASVTTTAIEGELARARSLTSMSLSAPNAQKVENFMFAQFGILPSQIAIPKEAQFTTRSKPVALGGAGRGTPAQFIGDWKELAARLDAIQYFRNAVVHADSHKLSEIPKNTARHLKAVTGSIWARQKNDTWSIQMPHAVTAVRTTVAVFNTVASELLSVVKYGASVADILKPPDDIVPFD